MNPLLRFVRLGNVLHRPGLASAIGAVGIGLLIAGCDYVAERKLVVGQHTEADVRNIMGRPEMVWGQDPGPKRLEYPRGPMGKSTYFVFIDKDGKYQGMEQALTDRNFSKVRQGMSRDDVREVLGKPTSEEPYPLKKEVVWTWRYDGDGGREMIFNAHFDQHSGKVVRTSRQDDPTRQGG